MWASTLSLVETDEYNIEGALRQLALAHHRIRNTLNNKSREHSQRRGIDDIIEIAFSARDGSQHRFWYVFPLSSCNVT